MNALLAPPVAFLAYIGLVIVLYGFGRLLAPATSRGKLKSALYAGGEVASSGKAAPGYGRFFVIALFFAVLHLGALVLATVGLAGPVMGGVLGPHFWYAILFYVGGLLLTLVVLVLS